MTVPFAIHNLFKTSFEDFLKNDPQLKALSKLPLQHASSWWSELTLSIPGIYILSGGRQIGKSTSCKLFIKHCLEKKIFTPENIFYLPCDEIYDAKELSQVIRSFLDNIQQGLFLLIIDEITFVKNWDTVIKALADEGHFTQGLCVLTGSDTVILKEAAMRFPGRRGFAKKTDFHLYPLTFEEFVHLRNLGKVPTLADLQHLFQDYLLCGGYLRAINDLAQRNEIADATFQTYEQWIRGDFLKRGKSENYLLSLLQALMKIGVSPISYSEMTHKIGLMSKETCIDYIKLLERMDILIELQAFDQNKKVGFPRKDRKFHFLDPFIQRTIHRWLTREGFANGEMSEANLVEACGASHCYRFGKVFYLKGQGEIDVIWLKNKKFTCIEIKWSKQIRSNDLKMLKQFPNSMILGKNPQKGNIEGIELLPIYQFLYEITA